MQTASIFSGVHEPASFCSFLVWAGVSAIMAFQWRR